MGRRLDCPDREPQPGALTLEPTAPMSLSEAGRQESRHTEAIRKFAHIATATDFIRIFCDMLHLKAPYYTNLLIHSRKQHI